ncbi:ABC transporter ATP-binding protein [Paenibacillus sp. J31TS4]|uniref:ABC transporter ATP-binding protein n=1 Tax=Paenibacillus sp. J31TS4 TaxID=2807195 RepID=UPI001AFE006C|nr:ABC transporter ATP-binding protein [Paenibacillus sp. J31TS4]GIP41251.1 ABC transporter ATP-binding protein [Paenibacillus sp. J31TS4]
MLELHDLTIRYDAGDVVRDVNMTIRQGEIVGLIGSNGAGKTSIMKTISGLVKPRSGRILFAGQDITGTAPSAVPRLGISHVPEGRRIFGDLTVEENLLVGAYRHGRGTHAAELERVYGLFPILAERRKQRAGNMSGGEQQMLAIGRALMARPSFLILDEPSLGLAPLVIRSVFQMIREIHREGMTILLVEQNVELALRHVDRSYVIQSGEIVLEGTPEELRAREGIMDAYLGTGEKH